MKALSIILCFLISSVFTNAQSKLVKYFKKLSTEAQHGITLTEKEGKVTAETGTGTCTVTHDAVNGYLQIVDDGTGGGKSYFEMAIFKDAKGKEYLVTSAYVISADGAESNGNSFYQLPDMSDATYAIWPDIGYIEDLLSNGVTKENIEPYKASEYSYFVLPRKGTVVSMVLGFTSLDQKVNEGDAKAKALKAKLKPTKFKWNKANATFEITT